MLHHKVAQTGSLQCAVNYGIYGLDSHCLQVSFFPEDLPADWRLEYYNNEFNLILITLDELAAAHGVNKYSISSLCADIRHIMDELHERFILLLELNTDFYAALSKDELQQFVKLKRSMQNLHFVRDEMSAIQTDVTNDDFSLYSVRNLLAESRNSCLIIKEQCQLTPPVLRRLLETCFQQTQNMDELWILFSSKEHALENCRNAIIMDSLL